MPVRLRTQRISIDLPQVDSEPWVQLIVQRINLDDSGNVLSVIDRWDQVNKKLSEVALEAYPYFEVIPDLQNNLISGFGIADAIKGAALNWIADKYNGTIVDNDVVLLP